jgi:hypothetical protein
LIVNPKAFDGEAALYTMDIHMHEKLHLSAIPV